MSQLDPSAIQSPPPRAPAAALIYLLAIVGGVIGILAAVWEELAHGSWLGMVLVGPAIEEACKPLLLIILIEKRPHWFRHRGQVVICAILAALVFATLENIVYVNLYHPTGGWNFVMWRYTICTALHVTASTVFAVGLAKMWRHIKQTGGRFDIDYIFRYYVAAVVIHAVYNTSMLIAEASGVLKFE